MRCAGFRGASRRLRDWLVKAAFGGELWISSTIERGGDAREGVAGGAGEQR